jgi:hypothetical protein
MKNNSESTATRAQSTVMRIQAIEHMHYSPATSAQSTFGRPKEFEA